MDPFINQTLDGGYGITDFIGKGGMSVVYRAVQRGTGRVVAVKILREELAAEEMYLKRFEREAKSLARMSHPGLVSVFDMGTAPNGQPYMVIEYLEGESLHDWIINNGKMSVREALPLFMQVCEVMVYAHAQGIIHRDIKPHNIMIVKQGRRDDLVKVVDFGIIKLDENIVSVSQKLTASGEICGSPMYMSPEQILDEPLDLRTDIYSFGIVMYEVLSGRPLFGGTKITEVMNKHVNVRPQPLTFVVADGLIPSRVDLAVRKCLEKSRNNRFQTMRDVKLELADILANLDALLAEAAQMKENMGTGETTVAATAGGGSPAASSAAPGNTDINSELHRKRNRMLLLAAALAFLALTAGAAVGLWMFQQPAGTHRDLRSQQSDQGDQANQTSRADQSSSTNQNNQNNEDGKTPSSQMVHATADSGPLGGSGAGVSAAEHRRQAKRRGGSDRTTLVEEMNATEKAHLQHNSGTSPDPFGGMPDRN